LVNRIGDFGFALGILTIYMSFGSLDYETVFSTAASQSVGRITLISLLLFCGALGKSAQLPLYVWLPDAMEGPTPVSALIHAATMVTAGVYMVARCGALFALSTTACMVVAVVGALTAVFAATIALAQYDMKRILAYSTISQLGYMFLGLGVLAPASAIFHLSTHAFFKALLFLGAGSVMHALSGEIDIRKIGGLRAVMPVTYVTFLIGSLALVGLVPFAGFFSKEEILTAAWGQARWLGVIGFVTALLTAFYTFRLLFGVFHGPRLVPPETSEHAHESGRWMTLPLIVLALGSILVGMLFGWPPDAGAFHQFLKPALSAWVNSSAFVPEQHAVLSLIEVITHHGVMWLVATVIVVVGIVLAWWLYRDGRRPSEQLAKLAQFSSSVRVLLGVHKLLNRKYYVDEVYEAVIVRPLWWMGRFCYAVDCYVIDSLVWLVAFVPQALGFTARTTQQGALQGYGLSMVLTLVILLVAVLWLIG